MTPIQEVTQVLVTHVGQSHPATAFNGNHLLNPKRMKRFRMSEALPNIWKGSHKHSVRLQYIIPTSESVCVWPMSGSLSLTHVWHYIILLCWLVRGHRALFLVQETTQESLYIYIANVLQKPQWKFPSRKFPPEKLSPRKFPPMKIAPYENTYLWKLPPMTVTPLKILPLKITPRELSPMTALTSPSHKYSYEKLEVVTIWSISSHEK